MSPEAQPPPILVSNTGTQQQETPQQPSPSAPLAHLPPQPQETPSPNHTAKTSSSASAPMRRSSTNSRIVNGPGVWALADPPLSLSPSNSRCTSPKMSRDANHHHHPSAPPSPSRSFTTHADTSGGLFERDVEFPSEHVLNAQEAQDVAIPPILQEAAEVLTGDDLQPEHVHTMIRSAASSSALSSLGTKSPGWQSPVQQQHPQPITSSSPSNDVMASATSSSAALHSPLRASSSNSTTHPSPIAITSSSSSHKNAINRRSAAAMSPSRSSAAYPDAAPRPGSPMSSHLSTSPPESALFTPSTSPSPPPQPPSSSMPAPEALSASGLDPIKPSNTTTNPISPQTIQSRMGWAAGSAGDDEAASNPLDFREPSPPRKPPLRPELLRGSTSDALQLPGAFPSGSGAAPSAVSMSPSASQHLSYPASPAAELDADAITLASSTADGASGSAPRNRRLSFMSYADIINSERAEADLTMTANGGSMSHSLSMHQLWHDLPPPSTSSEAERKASELESPVGAA